MPFHCVIHSRLWSVAVLVVLTACASKDSEFEIVNTTYEGTEIVRAEASQEFTGKFDGLKAKLTVACFADAQRPRLLVAVLGFVRGEDDWEPAPDITPKFRLGTVFSTDGDGAFDIGQSVNTGLPHVVSYNLYTTLEILSSELARLRSASEEGRQAIEVAREEGADSLSVAAREAAWQETERARTALEDRIGDFIDLHPAEALAKIGPTWSVQPWFFTDTTLRIDVPVERLAPVFDRCRQLR